MSYQQQPQPVPTMVAATNASNKPLKDYEHGLCGCTADLGTFCLSWCCPCITYGRVKHRFENANDPGSCCSSDCMIHGILTSCGFGFVMQFMLRGDIRRRYHIKGGSLNDCLSAFCCTPCELTQESLELDFAATPEGQRQQQEYKG